MLCGHVYIPSSSPFGLRFGHLPRVGDHSINHNHLLHPVVSEGQDCGGSSSGCLWVRSWVIGDSGPLSLTLLEDMLPNSAPKLLLSFGSPHTRFSLGLLCTWQLLLSTQSDRGRRATDLHNLGSGLIVFSHFPLPHRHPATLWGRLLESKSIRR